MIRHGVRHRTTGVFLAAHPSFGYAETTVEADAVSWMTEDEANQWRLELGEFADAWAVVRVVAASIYDKPEEPDAP